MRARSPLWLLTLPLAVVPLRVGAQPAPAAPSDAGRVAPPRSAAGPSAPGRPPPRRVPAGTGARADIPVPTVDPFADRPGGEGPRADMSPTTDLSKNWGYSRSSRGAPKPRYVDMPSHRVVAPPNPIGFYSGIHVDSGAQPPPWAPADPAAAPPTLTWPGFERSGNSSRVFFQLSRAVQYEFAQQGRTITVRMVGVTVNVRNNARPLDLRYHRTPGAGVVVRAAGGDAVATLTLKRDSVPQVHQVTAPNGYMMLVLEFPDPAPAPTPPPVSSNN